MMNIKTPEELYRGTKENENYKGFYQLSIKRLIDIIICLIALPFVLIILIPVAIAIKLKIKVRFFIIQVELVSGSKNLEC